MFNGSGKAIDKGPAVMAEDFLDIQGKMLWQMYKFKTFPFPDATLKIILYQRKVKGPQMCWIFKPGL